MAAVRRHLVVILSVLVALAVGLALGGGPLQGKSDADQRADLEQRAGDLESQVDELEQGQLFTESMGQAVAAGLLDGKLNERGVALFALPGVTDQAVSGVREAITAAGGLTVVTARIGQDYVDPSQKTYVDSVSDNAVQGVSSLAEMEGAETYERSAALIARAYTGHGDGLEFDDASTKLDGQLQGSKLVTVEGEVMRRANLVVVLAPADSGGEDLNAARQLIQADLVAGLADGSDGVVVAAPAESAEPGGLIDAITARQDLAESVSTLNVVDSAAAQVAVVYALSAVAAGNAGTYGVDGSDVVLPPGLTPPTG